MYTRLWLRLASAYKAEFLFERLLVGFFPRKFVFCFPLILIVKNASKKTQLLIFFLSRGSKTRKLLRRHCAVLLGSLVLEQSLSFFCTLEDQGCSCLIRIPHYNKLDYDVSRALANENTPKFGLPMVSILALLIETQATCSSCIVCRVIDSLNIASNVFY